jgi:hypothetical protein
MRYSATLNEITIKGRRSAIDNIELVLFRNNIDSDVIIASDFFSKMFGLGQFTDTANRYIVPQFTDLSWERQSNTSITIKVDSNGGLMHNYLIAMADKYKVQINYTYEDDSMDIGGNAIFKPKFIIRDISYPYLAHKYKQDGIDGIVLDIEDYVAEGDTFEEFMNAHSLWTFISKSDKKTIEAMFNKE